MATTISVTEIARHLADYINRVAYRGERFFLVRGNRTVAELRPVPQGTKLGGLPALLDDLPHLTVDEANGFIRDLEEIRKEQMKSDISPLP